jgi:hypothetical protein
MMAIKHIRIVPENKKPGSPGLNAYHKTSNILLHYSLK